MNFLNREDAGKKMALELEKLALENTVVLCIPRGGLAVGAEIAKHLNTALDLIIPRKIGSPVNPEIAIGAIAQDGTTYLNQALVSALGVDKDSVNKLVDNEIKEIQRRMTHYRGHANYPDYSGKNIIITDDGVATGYTILAAAEYTAETMKPEKLIIAVPVCPADTLGLLQASCDRVVCLDAPEIFYSVGQFYVDFHQISDKEVQEIIAELASLNIFNCPVPPVTSLPGVNQGGSITI